MHSLSQVFRPIIGLLGDMSRAKHCNCRLFIQSLRRLSLMLFQKEDAPELLNLLESITKEGINNLGIEMFSGLSADVFKCLFPGQDFSKCTSPHNEERRSVPFCLLKPLADLYRTARLTK